MIFAFGRHVCIVLRPIQTRLAVKCARDDILIQNGTPGLNNDRYSDRAGVTMSTVLLIVVVSATRSNDHVACVY